MDTYKCLSLASSFVDKTIRPIVNTFDIHLNVQPSLVLPCNSLHSDANTEVSKPSTQGRRSLVGNEETFVTKHVEYIVVTNGNLSLIWRLKIQSLLHRKHCGPIAETKQLMLFREIVLCLLWLITLEYPLCFIISSGSERTADLIPPSTAGGHNALNGGRRAYKTRKNWQPWS
jgi:hypothetical protein